MKHVALSCVAISVFQVWSGAAWVDAQAPRPEGAIAATAFVSRSNANVSGAPVYPGVEWQVGPGLPDAVRRRVDEYVHSLDTTGLIVIQHGRIAYQYGDISMLSYSASTRKSILSMLYGNYVANGTIPLNKALKEMGISDVGGLLPIEERARVIDLISARSGVYHEASYSGDSLGEAPARGSQEPGTYWLYSNWDFNAAGAVFEKLTGKNIYDALRDDLAVPIGMQDFQRERQHKDGDLTRSIYPAYPMWLSTRDMARLGYLMLRDGRWNDRQIIPADWVKKSTSVVTPTAELHPEGMRSFPIGYGYLWWVWDKPAATGAFEGAYTAWGSYGQAITVLPALDMVIAHKTIPANHNVDISDYLRLLDRLAGRVPASEEILPVLWAQGEEKAFELGKQLAARPEDRIVDESDLYAAGVGLFRKGDARKAEQVLHLNSRLYPRAVRTLIALSRAQAAAGESSDAIDSIHKALALQPDNPAAKVQVAALGVPIEGHTASQLGRGKAATVAGVYISKDSRYAVKAYEGHLLFDVSRNGDIYDEFEAFAEADGQFFAPEDGRVMRFAMDGKGNAANLEVSHGNDIVSAAREQ